ncbi:MAG: hypothetical protein GY768_02475 [Planctomycetaceae bacterium]|nr:hypothetical protein [Planctomycetaceae bacterium]
MRFCLAFWIMAIGSVVADDNPSEPPKPIGPDPTHAVDSPSGTDKSLSNAEIDRLIQRLNSDRFSHRQAATKKLAEAGSDLIPRIVEVVQDGPAESAARGIEILEQHFQSDDPKTQAAARQALRKLADAEHGRSSRLAKRALGESVPTKPAEKEIAKPAQNIFRINNGQFKFKMRLNGAGVERATRKNVNGIKDTLIKTGGQEITIHEEPNGKIKISVTEQGAKGKKTTEYKADNLEQLKQKHPAAHQLHKKYGEGKIGLQIKIQPGPGLPAIQLQEDKDLQQAIEALEKQNDLDLQQIDEETNKSLQESIERLRQKAKP